MNHKNKNHASHHHYHPHWNYLPNQRHKKVSLLDVNMFKRIKQSNSNASKYMIFLT